MKRDRTSIETLRGFRKAFILLAVVSIMGGISFAARNTRPVGTETARPLMRAGMRQTVQKNAARTYSLLPLSFEPNRGQTDTSVQYVAHGLGYVVFLDRSEAVLSFEQQGAVSPTFRKLNAKQQKKMEERKVYRALAHPHRSRNRRVVRIGIDGANVAARMEPLNELPGKANYFVGSNRHEWITDVPSYLRIRYAGIYPGVDLVYYGKQGQLEFDFVVSPGADPKKIALKFGSDERATLTRDGSLRLGSHDGAVLLHQPTIYQVERGERQSVRGGFVLLADGRVGIHVGSYDRNEPLIVDPVLAYSTFLDGSGISDADGIVVDSKGDTYVVGSTQSTDFPVVNGYQSGGITNWVAFVSEFNPTGTALLYSTYLGGTSEAYGQDIAIDASANVYVTGYTFSSGFPVVNGFQASNNDPTYGNAFIARINTTQNGTASLVYSSYLGGGGNANSANFGFGDGGYGIAADSSGIAYVTGITTSDTSVVPFPTTASAYQSSLKSPNGNAFLTAVNTNLSGAASLVYSTYLGGDGAGSLLGDMGAGVAVDGSGNAYVIGETTSDASGPFPTTSSAFQSALNSPNGNAFLSEIATNQSGSQSLVYSTYFGGSTTNALGDYAAGVALDSAGKVYVAGDALSSNFPTTSGAYQTINSPNGKAYAAKFDLTQSGTQSLIYSTLLGGMDGSQGETDAGIAVDPNGDAFIAGDASSSDFPTTPGAFQSVLKSSAGNTFLSELNSNATSLLYSTYLGGSSTFGDMAIGLALDSLGDNAYIAGFTKSTDFPAYPSNAFQTSTNGYGSAFVAKFAIQLRIGSFMPVGTLVTPLTERTATLLQNGQVLLTGGVDNSSNVYSSAELYNPTTQTFSATGRMYEARFLHTATLLPNGKVLITGGNSNTTQLSTAELYNPATGTFSYTGNMSTARSEHSATLLKNGQVLVAGGNSNGTAELYNPSSGTFTPTGSLTTARSQHTATLLENGTVLVVGGQYLSSVLASAEIYNPTAGTFTATTGSLNDASYDHTATLLNNGNVLIAGGENGSVYGLARTEIYNPASQTFALSANLDAAVSLQSATALNTGMVLIVGGLTNSGVTATAQLFNPSNQTITRLGSLEIARASHTATLLNDGTVLVAGGSGYNGAPVALSELYAVTPPRPPSLQVTPSVANMEVGGTQQFTAVDNNGNPRSDLTWTVSNYSLASITSDSSPTLTALAAGQVTLTATDGTVSAQAQITIVAVGSITPGTALWSVPLTPGFSALQLAQAMPTANGPDLFSIQSNGTQSFIQALSDDGQQSWQASLPAVNGNSFPDAFGGVLVTEHQTCNTGQTDPMSVVDLDAGTGQPIWQITSQGIPGAGPQGSTLYCYPEAPQIAIRAATDGAIVISAPGNTAGLPELMLVDGTSGQPIVDVSRYIPPSKYTLSDGTVLNGYSPIGPPIVSSDGSAYVEYEVRQIAYPPKITSAVLYILKIAADQYNTPTTTQLSSTTQDENLFPGRIIPDGQGGVLATWVISPSNPINLPIPTNPYQAAHVVSGAVTATYNLPFSPKTCVLGADGLPINPTLVLGENGVAFATDGKSSGDSTNNEGPKVVSFNLASGTVNWFYQVTSTSSVLSMMTAISGNGLDINDSQNGVTQFDSSGNASAVTGALGGVAQSSWNGNWVLQTAQGASEPLISPVTLPDSFSAMPGGNQSGNGAAIEQVLTNQSQGAQKQLPDLTSPVCTYGPFVDVPPPPPNPTCGNVNAIELLTDKSPDYIFQNYLQTFVPGIVQNSLPNNPEMEFSAPGGGPINVTGPGQQLNIALEGIWKIGQGPFSVLSERVDSVNHVISAVTLKGHPLAGWRYWRVYSIGTNDVVIETGAYDQPGPGLKNYAGFFVSRHTVSKGWFHYLQFIQNKLGAAQGSNLRGTLGGIQVPLYRFDQDILSEGYLDYPGDYTNYILSNVCQSTSCN